MKIKQKHEVKHEHKGNKGNDIWISYEIVQWKITKIVISLSPKSSLISYDSSCGLKHAVNLTRINLETFDLFV